jgi:hypothetical protein
LFDVLVVVFVQEHIAALLMILHTILPRSAPVISSSN